jgi:hypothetical protein
VLGKVVTIYAYVNGYVFMGDGIWVMKMLVAVLVVEVIVGIGAIIGMVTRGRKVMVMKVGVAKGIVFVGLFLVIAIGVKVVEKGVIGDGKCEGSIIQWISSGIKANQIADMFCLMPLCYCEMTNYNDYSPSDIAALNISRPHRTSPSHHTQVQQCQIFIASLLNDTQTLSLVPTL